MIDISWSNSFCLTFSWTHHSPNFTLLTWQKIALVKVTVTCQLLNAWSISIPLSPDLPAAFNPSDHLSSLQHFLYLALRILYPPGSPTPHQGHSSSVIFAGPTLFPTITPGLHSLNLSSSFFFSMHWSHDFIYYLLATHTFIYPTWTSFLNSSILCLIAFSTSLLGWWIGSQTWHSQNWTTELLHPKPSSTFYSISVDGDSFLPGTQAKNHRDLSFRIHT